MLISRSLPGFCLAAFWVSWLAAADLEDAPSTEEIAAPATVASAAPLQTFAQRRKWVLDEVAKNPGAYTGGGQPFFAAEACFLSGNNEQGRKIAHDGYLSWGAKDPKRVRATDFFRLWPAMDCYVRWKKLLDEESRSAFKRYMTNIDCYSYSYTPNLSMLLWTTRLLGGQEWGDTAFVPAKRDTASHYKANPDIPMKQRLLGVLQADARTGGEEYASRPYGAANLAPILCLAQLAADPELKERARITHQVMLARYAPIWLRGAMIITSRRSYPDVFNDPMGVADWFWVFFGGDMHPAPAGHMLDAAVLGEAPPALIEHAATDRTKPYTVFNRFQEGSSGRQISWVDHDYGLFSEAFAANPRAFGQTYPFGVRWITSDPRHYSILWFSVPALDELEVPGKVRGSHPHGFSVESQTTFQHAGSLLYVCAIKPGARYPHGLGFVPGGALSMIDEAADSGRVFLYYPGVLIAFTATKAFAWDHNAPLKMPNAPPMQGDSEFRIPGPVFAAAIETSAVSEFPASTPADCLRLFRNAILTRSHLGITDNTPFIGSHTDRGGNVIRVAFGGQAQVNGAPVDLEKWPQAESPWVQQRSATQPLTVTDGHATLTYDLQNWTVKESH